MDKIVPSRSAAAVIDALVLRCSFGGVNQAAPLCDWKGPVSELAAHQSTCPALPAPCKWQACRESVARNAVDAHAKVCVHRQEFCQLCREVQRGADAIESHKSDCLGKPLVCPSVGCTAKVRRGEMGAHRATCAFEVVPCAIPGCGMRIKRGDMNEHCVAASGTHTVALAGFMQTLNGSIQSLSANLHTLNSNVQRLATSLEAAERRRSGDEAEAAGAKRKKT
jgi:outer membrane murein-binding lipoprotein Lpp